MTLERDRAYLIDVAGVIVDVTPDNGTFELEEAQRHVEGYIEVVYLNEEYIMIVNEEGKFGKEYNSVATGVAILHNALLSGDFISGNAVVCPSKMLP